MLPYFLLRFWWYKHRPDNIDFEIYYTNARFGSTILAKADFTTAINLMLDPEMNTLKKAKFSVNGLPGLLLKYDLKIIWSTLI